MPAKHRIKDYYKNQYYHIYNRGVEKRIIFKDKQDYAVFISYLKTYLEKKDEKALYAVITNPKSSRKEKDTALKELALNNFHDSLKLIAFVLMPNHFHLLVYQKEVRSIDLFMNSICTRYSMYFNRKYGRVGALYQGVYKAVLVTGNDQLLYLTKYIHRNPLSLQAAQGLALRSWSYSSYPAYLGIKKNLWVNSEEILEQFSQTNTYKDFVEESKPNDYDYEHELLADVILD